MKEISKKELEHLAELARLELKEGEETKLLKDLEKILDYFKELEAVDTENVEPMTGGTKLRNALREDIAGDTEGTGRGPELFPEKKNGYLKVPPIF